MQKPVRTFALVLSFALPAVMFARDPMGCNPPPRPQADSSLNTLLLAVSVVTGR